MDEPRPRASVPEPEWARQAGVIPMLRTPMGGAHPVGIDGGLLHGGALIGG